MTNGRLLRRTWGFFRKIAPNVFMACVAEEAAFKKKLSDVAAEEARDHPDQPVEVWASDEHRLGLKPVRSRVWAPIGERPLALGNHRYEWLYVTAFLQPTGGETIWYLSDGVSKPFFEKLLADFAETVGAGKRRRILLVLDNAGWHGEAGLAMPEGLRLVFLPPDTPELQPGRSSTNRSPTVVSKRSPTSSPFSPKDAANSSTIKPTSPKRQTSPGGQNPPNRSDQTNRV
jgi:hypothetical protein